MTKGLLFAALLSAVVVPAGAAAARDQLGERDTVVVDPQRAYILYRTPTRMDVRFLREVSEAQGAAHAERRQRAFARARHRYEQDISAWQRQYDDCGRRDAYCHAALGPRPIEVTDETFAYPPPELDNFVDVSRGRVFERSEGSFTYLRAIEPGNYVVYGPMIVAPNGAAAGVCLCMGSVRFEARPGQIVDLGELRLVPDEADAGTAQGRFGPDGRLPSPVLVAPAPGAERPARLAALPVVPAELHGADRMPNYFGVLIDRLAPVPGVLAYERDRVIDLAGQPGQAIGNAAPTTP